MIFRCCMNPYATGISHDNPLRIDALYGCPHVLPKEHTFNFITLRYLRIERKSLMEPLYLRGHYLSSDEERKNIKKTAASACGGCVLCEWNIHTAHTRARPAHLYQATRSTKDTLYIVLCYKTFSHDKLSIRNVSGEHRKGFLRPESGAL